MVTISSPSRLKEIIFFFYFFTDTKVSLITDTKFTHTLVSVIYAKNVTSARCWFDSRRLRVFFLFLTDTIVIVITDTKITDTIVSVIIDI